MNHGNLLTLAHQRHPLPRVEGTHQQCLRLATLQAVDDRISNAIAELPIFPHDSFNPETLYASEKFGVARPTVKARHSRKYFGRATTCRYKAG